MLGSQLHAGSPEMPLGLQENLIINDGEIIIVLFIMVWFYAYKLIYGILINNLNCQINIIKISSDSVMTVNFIRSEFFLHQTSERGAYSHVNQIGPK